MASVGENKVLSSKGKHKDVVRIWDAPARKMNPQIRVKWGVRTQGKNYQMPLLKLLRHGKKPFLFTLPFVEVT